MHRAMNWIGLLCFLGLGIAGCASTPDPCARVLKDAGSITRLTMNTVHFVDASHDSENDWVTYCRGDRLGPPPSGAVEGEGTADIQVVKHDTRKTLTDTLEVWATLRNKTEEKLHIEARAQFFDRDRIPSEPPTAWERLILSPKGIHTFRSFSLGDDAMWYQIEIRHAPERRDKAAP